MIQRTNNATVTIQAHDGETLKTCKNEVSSIKSLSGKGIKSMQVVGSDASRPAGCVAYPVSTTATVFLYVKGRVDMDAEITKAQKKLDKVKISSQKQEKLLQDAGYKEKVSPAVLESDQKRMAEFKQEIHSLEETLKQFEQLKLE